MTVAQNLDRRITIERFGGVENEYGEIVDPQWTPLATLWASREDVSDGEKLAAGGIGGFVAARFVVRHSLQTADIRYSDRLIHEGREWNVIGLKEAKDGRRRFIEITANVAAP